MIDPVPVERDDLRELLRLARDPDVCADHRRVILPLVGDIPLTDPHFTEDERRLIDRLERAVR